jgi:hypothetical protein
VLFSIFFNGRRWFDIFLHFWVLLILNTYFVYMTKRFDKKKHKGKYLIRDTYYRQKKMAEAAPSAEPSPFKAPSKAEKAERTRNLMLLPLFAVPLGISAYFAFGKENAKGLSWFSLRKCLQENAV